jgi:ATP-dependent exoDNAse (exonuclease V) alpha subunit
MKAHEYKTTNSSTDSAHPMLRITESESTQAAKNYYTSSLERGDYYLEGQEIAGHWGGKGAAQLGLTGKVEREIFCDLIENIAPNGERLTQRNVKNRRPGYDFTFDVPKSVSLLNALAGDERIVEAMKRALDETMKEIEREMHTRVRKNGADEDRKTGNMIWADFLHFTSRPTLIDQADVARLGEEAHRLKNRKGEILLADPHLHVHVYAINATFDPIEQQWKAGVFMQAKRDARYYQAAYHTRLAGELQKLGYEIEQTANAFEISDVSRELIEKFSRRTKEVEDLAKLLGITSENQKSRLAAVSRRRKNQSLKHSELRNLWEKLSGAEEVQHLKGIVSAAQKNPAAKAIDRIEKAHTALTYALGKELERVSETSQRRLLASALEHSIGFASVNGIYNAFQQRDEILRATINSEKRVSTKEILNEECTLLDIIREGKGTSPRLYHDEYQFRNPLFTKASAQEQREAIRKIMSSQDWVMGLIGRAGTGKTTLLKEISAGLEQINTPLIAVAPTAEAARGVLRGEGFKSAETVKRLLADRSLQAKLKGGVLWIDEAGMLGNRDLIELLNVARSNKARKVILSGDPTQIRSVPRGDALRFLQENSGLVVCNLEKIQRQKSPELKKAVEAISKSQIETGFEILKKTGGISEIEKAKMSEELAQAYVDRVKNGRKSVLVVCPTHAEGRRITDEIRKKLKDAGILENKEKTFVQTVNLSWTNPEKSRASIYQPDMIVQFRKNSKGFLKGERVRIIEVDSQKQRVVVYRNNEQFAELPLKTPDRFDVFSMREIPVSVGDRLRVTQNTIIGKDRYNNGDSFKVKGFTDKGDIELTTGKVIPENFGHLAHGYVHTADASQAKTVDSVLIGIGSDSMSATDMRRFYVAVSRARYEAKIFTDDMEMLKEAASRDTPRRFASEINQEDRQRRVLNFIHERERQKHIEREKVAAPITRNLTEIIRTTPKIPDIEIEM